MGSVGISLTLIAFALGGWNIEVGEVNPQTLSLGVDWLILAFLGSAFIFITLEKIFPKYKNQIILRPQWGLDLFYFCFNHLAISAVLIYANYHVGHFDWAVSTALQSFIQSNPILLQTIFIIICADFVLYWEHRLYHEVKVLWPVHAVHHSVENLDWLAGSRGHFIQVFTERAMVMVPLYLLGCNEEALNLYVAFAALQAVLIHCNVDLPFGVFRYIIVTPQFHHWHHTSDPGCIDRNFAISLPLLDLLFGTYHSPPGKWPKQYGQTGPKIRANYLAHLIAPFRNSQ